MIARALHDNTQHTGRLGNAHVEGYSAYSVYNVVSGEAMNMTILLTASFPAERIVKPLYQTALDVSLGISTFAP